MIKVGLGQAEGIDTLKTVNEVISKCEQQLQGKPPQAGIVLAANSFDHQRMLTEIHARFPQIELIGCTTSGEFSSNYGFSDDSIILMTFYSDDLEIQAGVGRDLSINPRASVRSAVNQAKQNLTLPPRLGLAFPDGFDKIFDPIMKLLYDELGQDCPVFGGAAGTIWNESQTTHQFYATEILQDAIPFLIFAGPLEYAFSIANSWKPIGKRTKVTESDGREVRRIGDFSAVDFYKHYLGDHTDPAREFTLAVYEKDSDQFYLRAPITYQPDNSIIFTDIIHQGSTVQLTEAIRETIIEDTQASTARLTATATNLHPAFALAFSCAFRKDMLGTRVAEELNILRQNLSPDLPISGFYSFGEIAPLTRGQQSYLHGATLVTLLVGQPNGDADAVIGSESAIYQNNSLSGPRKRHPQDHESVNQLRQENKFLHRKLLRSESYRNRMEEIKDFNATLHRKIIQEVEEARVEIQQKEEALRKSEEKYRRIVETAGEGFLLMDQDLVIKDVNDSYCRMVKYSRNELIGKTPMDLATEEHRQFLLSNKDELLARDHRRTEGTVIAKDGRQVPILAHGSTLRNDRGEPIGEMAFITDMTEHKKALELAGEVQKSLLPQTKPRVQGLDVAGRNISCDEIGGDYFDFLWRRENPEGPFSVAVGDISGHGVDSALLMTSARAFLRMRASQPGTMADIITAMNRHLTQDILETGRFMTLFYMTIDPAKDRIEWIRAGHDPAILYDPGRDTFEELKGGGLALGVNDTVDYQTNHRTGITDGQIIAIGTDGIWEARNKTGEMFGKERFRGILREKAQDDAEVVLNAVYMELDRFTRGQKAEDDITLVVIKVNLP